MFFFILPAGVDFQTRRLPVVTFTVMGICAAVYLVNFLLWIGSGLNFESDYEFFMLLGYVPTQATWYSWFTHLFVHADVFHLLFNMIYLFLFGSCVEDLLGRGRYVAFYLAGGVIALLVYNLFAIAPADDEPLIPLVGASGAISACMGGFFYVLNRSQITLRWIFIFFIRVWSGTWQLPAKVVMSVWFLTDLLGMIGDMGSNEGGVAFSAHVGGFLGGLGLMALIKHGFGLATEEEEGEEYPVSVPTRTVSEAATLFLHFDGNQIGPITPTQFQQMRALGSIPDGAFFWHEGMDEWLPVDDTLDSST